MLLSTFASQETCYGVLSREYEHSKDAIFEVSVQHSSLFRYLIFLFQIGDFC